MNNEDAVALALADHLLDGSRRPGQRLPSERQWAAELGLTRHQLRLALAKLVEQGTLHRRRNKGYYVADPVPYRPPKTSTGIRTIGLVAPDVYSVLGSTHSVRRLSERAQESNFIMNLVGYNTAGRINDREIVAHLLEKRLYDAYLWIPDTSPHVHEVAVLFQKHRAPVICITDALTGGGPTAVSSDFWQIGVEAANFVAAAGHKRVLYAAYTDMQISQSMVGTAFQGVLRQQAHVQVQEFGVQGTVNAERRQALSGPMWQAIESFQPTVVFAGSRMFSEIVLDVLAEHAVRVPDQMSFIGVGALHVGRLRGLDCTSFVPDEETLHRITLEQLDHMLENPNDEVRQHIRVPSIIHLGSTLKSPAGSSDDGT